MTRITQELHLHRDPWCNDQGVDGEASYDPREPLAVKILPWCSTRQQHVTWKFALDLLWPWHEGVPGGDVHVDWAEHTVALSFSSPSGRVTFHVDKAVMTAFLDRVRDAMPNDDELDKQIQAALGELESRLLGGRSHH